MVGTVEIKRTLGSPKEEVLKRITVMAQLLQQEHL